MPTTARPTSTGCSATACATASAAAGGPSARPNASRTPPPDRTTHVDTADAVHRAMEGLSRINREVLVLRYFVQLTEQQTADVLDVPAGTVKSRLSRALAQLAADNHLADLTEGSTS